MINLVACILCTVFLILTFKFYEIFKVPTFQAIVVNYITCTIVGLLQFSPVPALNQVVQASWFPFALLLGTLFIFTFYLIAITAQRVGVTAASVASKISLVIPVLVSLLILQNNLKDYTWPNYLGMAVAVAAIVLTALPAGKNPQDGAKNKPALASLALPFLIFVSSGVGDALINYTNQYYLQPADADAFTTFTFATSAAMGTLVLVYQLFFRKQTFGLRSLVGGIVLGIPNYFSIYFLLKTLSAFKNDGAFLYPVINIGIILGGMAAAIILFKERLSKINLVGVTVAVVALILLSYQEIGNYLTTN
jgi:multidrug transporter EmrE-like cation transporter